MVPATVPAAMVVKTPVLGVVPPMVTGGAASAEGDQCGVTSFVAHGVGDVRDLWRAWRRRASWR